MAKVNLFWNPAGFELDSLGTKQLTKISDGDTPQVSFSIRMLSIDTPEVHYPGTQSPSKHDSKLAQLGDWIQQGKAPPVSPVQIFYQIRFPNPSNFTREMAGLG